MAKIKISVKIIILLFADYVIKTIQHFLYQSHLDFYEKQWLSSLFFSLLFRLFISFLLIIERKEGRLLAWVSCGISLLSSLAWTLYFYLSHRIDLTYSILFVLHLIILSLLVVYLKKPES